MPSRESWVLEFRTRVDLGVWCCHLNFNVKRVHTAGQTGRTAVFHRCGERKDILSRPEPGHFVSSSTHFQEDRTCPMQASRKVPFQLNCSPSRHFPRPVPAFLQEIQKERKKNVFRFSSPLLSLSSLLLLLCFLFLLFCLWFVLYVSTPCWLWCLARAELVVTTSSPKSVISRYS